MLVLIRDVFAAPFSGLVDGAAYDANREGIAAIFSLLIMGPVTNVLGAVGRRALGICAGSGADDQASQGADEHQCFAKIE